MARRTSPPFRADHVGSLLRQAEGDAITGAVRMQEETGLQSAFASTVEGNALTQDQQRAKLDLVVQTAADLWGS